MKQKLKETRTDPPEEWQYSHTRFESMLSYCARGFSNPDLPGWGADDHIAEMCDLRLDDTDGVMWSDPDGVKVREILNNLGDRIRAGDVRAAEILHGIATDAVIEILALYLREPRLFHAIAPQKQILPTFASIHPKTKAVMERMVAEAKLGSESRRAKQIGSKAYFTSDTPANVYARAIVSCIEFNREIGSPEAQERGWSEYDRQYGVKTRMLPWPQWVSDLSEVADDFCAENARAYWRKGKQIIAEELPEFHLRPEWKDYLRRKYKDGAKASRIQHAIFKDILDALETIAGANRDRKSR